MSDLAQKKLAAEIAKLEMEQQKLALDIAQAQEMGVVQLTKAQAETARICAESEETIRTIKYEAAANARHRVLDFTGGVNDANVETHIATLAQWARESHDPIVVRITSPGGSVIQGFVLYDFLKALDADGIPIITVGLGWCASMGGILLQAGRERLVGPNAYVLIHEISSYAIGSLSDIEDKAAFLKKMNDRGNAILAERSTMTKGEIARRIKRREWWLTAQEAVELGFADRIGYEGVLRMSA